MKMIHLRIRIMLGRRALRELGFKNLLIMGDVHTICSQEHPCHDPPHHLHLPIRGDSTKGCEGSAKPHEGWDQMSEGLEKASVGLARACEQLAKAWEHAHGFGP